MARVHATLEQLIDGIEAGRAVLVHQALGVRLQNGTRVLKGRCGFAAEERSVVRPQAAVGLVQEASGG